MLEEFFVNNGVPATTSSSWSVAPTGFEIGSTETSGHPGSSIDISNVDFSNFSGGFGLGLEDPVMLLDHDNMYPTAPIIYDGGEFQLGPRSEFSFDVQIATGSLVTLTVDRNTVRSALGTTDGYIGSAAAMAAVLTTAGQSAGLSATASGNTITFAADQTMYPNAGNRAGTLYVGNVRDTVGWLLEFDLSEIDVSGDEFTLEEYLTGVEFMLDRAIQGASLLGSLQMHIEIQEDFAEALSDSIEEGIGVLVDADMDEESTRLKALQAQQQLALQSLSVANTNAERILALFN